jgi:hypothetical protein
MQTPAAFNFSTSGETNMKQSLRFAAVVLCLSFLAVTVASAQVAYNEGPVERVVLIKINPGHFDAFMADIKKNVIPIWEAEKSSGLITGYQTFLNQTLANPQDFDFGYSLTYKNMAALDGLPDKVFEIRMKQYGDRSAEQKVIDKRVENAHVVSSLLIRDITLR